MTSAAQAIGSCQACCSPRVAPNASPPTPTAMTAAPSQSKAPRRFVSRLSGTSAVAQSAIRMSGTLTRKAARQLTVCTSKPPSSGPTIERGRGARRPEADGPAALLALEGGGDDREAAGDEQRSECGLHDARGDQELHGRRQPAADRGEAEADEADAEHRAPPVEVVERAGEDEQRREDDEVRAVDVGQPLEAGDERGWQLSADRVERDVHDRPVEKDDGRTEDRRDEDAAALAHRRILAAAIPAPDGGQLITSAPRHRSARRHRRSFVRARSRHPRRQIASAPTCRAGRGTRSSRGTARRRASRCPGSRR